MFLPAGQPHRPLADYRVVALGQVADEVMRVGRFGRRFQLFLGCVWSAETQVLGNGPVEQVGVLSHDGDLVPQLTQGNLTDICAAQQYPAALGVEEAQDRPDDGGLAGATGAN